MGTKRKTKPKRRARRKKKPVTLAVAKKGLREGECVTVGDKTACKLGGRVRTTKDTGT